MNILKILFLFLFSVGMVSCSNSKGIDGKSEKVVLKNWQLLSSTQISVEDKNISLGKISNDGWLDVEVPTTVLRALVKAKVYPDPHFDLNNFLIPDASDDMNKRLKLEKYSHIKGNPNPFKDPYWFRTEFKIANKNSNKKVWLNFDGINYRADVWINGNQIADSSKMVGMFQRFKFDITKYVNASSNNYVAVKIYQVDHPGSALPGKQLEVFGPQRGWGIDIFKDATLKFSAGWDCAPVIRDRNMGLYQDVFLTYTDAIDIIDPYIITDLPLPDTTVANISISTKLFNASKKSVKGILKGSINMVKEVDFYTYKKEMPGKMETVNFEKEVEIPAGKTITVYLNPEDFPQLKIKNPYLWWPNGYGMQYLHNLTLSFVVDGNVSDTENTTFGIREITNTIKEIDGEFGRTFHVNGKRIFARGGWLQPDMLLDMNKKRMYDEARLLANANVNMIGSEDMPSPPEHVMETYDKYGLLMWETFFQCWTSYPGTESFANPTDANLAIKGAKDIVKRYRNHPSLAIWAIANETVVRKEIYSPVREYVKKMDTTRTFLATSSYDWDIDKLTPYMKQDLPTGMTDDGAPDYTWYPHSYYYNKVVAVEKQMFRNEMGVPSVPTLSSMKKFIFDLGKGKKNNIYPLDKNWAHHGGWDDNGYVYRAYDVALRSRYGKPATAEEYIKNAQYINAGSYRAMYEAANHRMWDITQGVMLWKLNSTWPTIVWQLYDWFLNPTSAYYYTKKALEPLHIQLNENDFTVSIINTQHKNHKDLIASVKVLDFNLNVKWETEKKFSIGKDRYKELTKLPKIKDLTSTYFVKLILKNSSGKIVSDNFYWFSTKEKTDITDFSKFEKVGSDRLFWYSKNDNVDFTELAKLKKVNLDMSYSTNETNGQYHIEVTVKNSTDKLAFFNRLLVTKGNGGEEVLPTFWDDNFFTLLPGEEKIVTAKFSKNDLDGKEPVVVLDEN